MFLNKGYLMHSNTINLKKLIKIQQQLQNGRNWNEHKARLLIQALHQIEIYPEGLVHFLLEVMSYKDPELAAHCLRVMHYSKKIGMKLGLSQNELQILEGGSKIHDLGKIAIPDFILNKPSTLTYDEIQIVNQHPKTGYELIKSIPSLRKYLPIVLSHHEKLDGSGYPDHLKSEQITLEVRIATIADIYDAMTSNRPYRPRLHPNFVIEELWKEAADGKIDPFIVNILSEIIKQEQKTIGNILIYQPA